MLSTNPKDRKERPIARGVLDYFPDAIAEVAHVSFIGNKQHNPGEEMHWAKHKSTDHADCIARHLVDRGTLDNEGLRHSAKIAWRALALLQIEIEADQKSRGNDNCRDGRSIYEQRNPYTRAAQVPQDSAWQPKGHDNGCVASNPADSECATTLRDETDPHGQPLTAYQGGPLHAPTGGKYAMTLLGVEDRLATDLRRQTTDVLDLRQRLVRDYYCPSHVARQIAGGTTFSYAKPLYQGPRPFAYVAGPMRGHPQFNFPAFDAARDTMLAEGFNVISPADIDRAAGDDQSDDQAAFFLRDMFCLYFLKRQGDSRNKVHVLPGWEQSVGAAGEFFGGRWLSLKFSNNWNDHYDAETAKHDFALRNSMA